MVVGVAPMTEGQIIDLYRSFDAVWFYDYNGDPKAPHAKLISGLCSDGYVNSAPVTSDPKTAGKLAAQLAERVRQRMGFGHVDWVVGSAYAAITFSYESARQLGARHGFVEKDPQNPKQMTWQRFVIPGGALVLQCEELITTLHTTMEVRRAIKEGNPVPVQFLPYVATAVYRPPRLDAPTDGLKIIALVTQEIKSWQPEECPLCKSGSPSLRPKHHWRELTGKK